MKKTIITHFFTTSHLSQVLRLIFFIINPLNIISYRKWKYINILENDLLKYLWVWDTSKIISFYNARSSLFHALNLLEIKKSDEIIIQSYTCVSVVNSVIQTWWKIVYSDIDETLNISIDDLKNKITKNTKAIIIQHTFWNPANISEIKKISKENNIILIEDCAHSLWAEFEWKKVWTFWDLWVFSFWRDKVISTVNWWFLVINNKKFFNKIDNIQKQLQNLPKKEVFKNIMYIFVSFKAKIFYDFFGLWKFIIYFSRKIKLIPEVLESCEKNIQNKKFFFKYPSVLAYLWIKELEKIDLYNDVRIKKSIIYEENLCKKYFPETLNNSKNIYLRFVYFTKNREELVAFLKSKNILAWNWYDTVIAPVWTNLEKSWYIIWSCKKAEDFAKKTINLPNFKNVSKKEIFEIIWYINEFENIN